MDQESGSWELRVAYDGAVAFRPGQVFVPAVSATDPRIGASIEILSQVFRVPVAREDTRIGRHQRLLGGFDVPSAVAELRSVGVAAQPNHVFFANGNPLAGDPMTGRGRSSARPAPRLRSSGERPHPGGFPHVAVLDVPLPDVRGPYVPWLLQECESGCARTGSLVPGGPDDDGDEMLDRVAGHGMFVAGRIAEAEPRCAIMVMQALTNLGDGDELLVAEILRDLAGRVDIVSLSFGGYSLTHMAVLADAVRLLQNTPGPAAQRHPDAPPADQGAVVVASAGNDATGAAPYPAALPDVVSVAALGPDGPAPFTNYGPWVRACAAGVDVRSTFFDNFDGGEPAGPDGDPDTFDGAASWSGTSFAAPLVAGRLARMVREEGLLPKQAVHRLIDGPDLPRLPQLGTIVTA